MKAAERTVRPRWFTFRLKYNNISPKLSNGLPVLFAAMMLIVLPIIANAAQDSAKTPQDLLAAPADKPIRGMSWPALSPDGKTLCFTYIGDLWTVPVNGGNAVRMTVHEGLDAYAKWSPDSKWIAFSSLRNGNADIYLMPAEGGEPRQVTFHSSNDWLDDWSPDGKKLLFYSARDTKMPSLYSIDLHTRALKRLATDEEALTTASWSPDGATLAYTRAGQPWWRPRYKGSVAANIVLKDITTGKMRLALKGNEQQFWPLYAPDSKSIFAATMLGKSDTPNLWRIPTTGGEPHAVTHYTTDAVRFPTIARNGSLLAYIWNGDLYSTKPDGTAITKIDIFARSDDKINNQTRLTLTRQASQIALSPDGKTIGMVVFGDIWTIPIAGGDAKRLTEDAIDQSDIVWSPDGTKIVMVAASGKQPALSSIDVKTKAQTVLVSDDENIDDPTYSPDGRWVAYAKAGSHPGLYIVSSSGGAPRRLAEGNGNNNFGNGIITKTWSPDSRWIAFTRMDRYQNRDIWVAPSIGGAAVNITRYPGINVLPKFTPDGRNLLFLSDRKGPLLLFAAPLENQDEDADDDKEEGAKPKPKPDNSKNVKIDFEDIHLRARQITPPIGSVDDFDITPDSMRLIVHIGGNFWSTTVKPGPAQQLTVAGEPAVNLKITPDGTRFYYLGAGGTPRSMSISGGPPTQIAFSAPVVYDRRVIYQQSFDEFYRRFGTAFYDSKLHGIDWKATRIKYEPLLQAVATPEEFANLLSEMVGEVNSSHSEISPAPHGSGPQTGNLGLFYDDSYAGPGIRVNGVLPKGPTDKASTRVLPNEYILSVDGVDVTLNELFYNTLQDKAGKKVELLVNGKPFKEGARTVKVKPISIAQWRDLDYDAMVRKNRERVEKLSAGRLAYIHIRIMDEPSLNNFERELWSDAMNKEGLVLDIRGNPGGNTHDAVLEALSRRVYGYTQPRDGLRQTQPDRAWTKPIVLLIDQNSYSDAEVFPAGFRSLHLGKIVGVPTPGYVIGTYEGHLPDGTSFRMPTWGFFTADGKNMENSGVLPDITIENSLEDIAAGKDRQLESAILTVLKQIPLTPNPSIAEK